MNRKKLISTIGAFTIITCALFIVNVQAASSSINLNNVTIPKLSAIYSKTVTKMDKGTIALYTQKMSRAMQARMSQQAHPAYYSVWSNLTLNSTFNWGNAKEVVLGLPCLQIKIK